MADFAATSLGPPGRFQQLIEELVAQHDREVQLLKSENEQLQEQIISVGIDYAHEETHGLKLEIEQLNEEIRRLQRGGDPEERCMEHPLREEAAEMLSGPPTITVDCLEELPEVRQGEVEPESGRGASRTRVAPEPLELDENSKPRLSFLNQGESPRESPERESIRESVELNRSVSLSRAVSHEDQLVVAWGEEGGEVLLHVPRSMLDKSIPFDVQTVGSAIRIGSGRMQLNCTRQQWILDCGGFLESEIHIEKATTPAGMRRTSITTRARIIERLEKLFDVKDGAAKVVMPADLGLAMHNATLLNTRSAKRQSAKFESRLAPEDLDEVMIELKRIHQKAIEKIRKAVHSQPVLSWSSFVECMLLQDLPKFSSGHAALHLFIVQRELLGDEMPATGTSQALLMAYEKAKKPVSTSQRWVSIVTALSTAAIIVSFAFMGISLDTDPDWPGWIILDGICAIIFVAEVVVKSLVLTPSEYFFGRDCVWNLFDVGLSFVAVTEIILSVLFVSAGAQTRAALALRGLRLARMARLAKLMRMPLLEELANLISGFVISVRSLFWVMIFLWLIVYVIALGFRAGVQTVSQSTTDRCGYGDYYEFKLPDLDGDDDGMTGMTGMTDPPLPPGCKLHYMYGVEFCGSVFGCMFSIFRCMISECTSKGGRSLTMIFSDGFGIQFDVFYAAAMVVVLFGLFNIITAIFVEATLNGLKENEVQRRYAKAYESNYMTEQLAKLVMTVSTQVQKLRSRTALPAILGLSSSNSNSSSPGALQNGEIYLSEEEFNQLVRQPDVRLILNDLDVSVEPRPGIFEAFSTEQDGTVSLSELVSGLMRLRGDLHKVDMVIAQMSLDHMQKQIGVKVVATRAASKIAMPKAIAASENAVSPGRFL